MGWFAQIRKRPGWHGSQAVGREQAGSGQGGASPLSAAQRQVLYVSILIICALTEQSVILLICAHIKIIVLYLQTVPTHYMISQQLASSGGI